MDKSEIQFILRAFRPGTDDEKDPQFQEALARVREDPELAEWLRQEMEWDRALRERLRDQPVPSGLRGDILAGQRAGIAAWNVRRRIWPWAAAAGLAVAVGWGALQ